MFVNGFSGSSRYSIPNSLRLRSSASAYLSRTFGTPTNNLKWTFSCWMKRGTMGVGSTFFGMSPGSNNYMALQWGSGDTLEWTVLTTSVVTARKISTQVFRDPSAWYHFVFVWDSANATSTSRMLMYVNGAQITSFSTSTDPSISLASYINTASTVHDIGDQYYNQTTHQSYTDTYIADAYFIDGQALTPSSFGQTDANGVWVPKAYTGTYGTNGFYLKFNDGSSTTNLCLDRSGNGNNWTPSGISVTAGATYDWMVDTPTNVYSAMNPLEGRSNRVAPSDGNLLVTVVSGTNSYWGSRGNVGVTTGKWYWESTIGVKDAGAGAWHGVGAVVDQCPWPAGTGLGANSGGFEYLNDGSKWGAGSVAAYGATYTTGDVIGVALDCDAQTITFYKNGTSQGTAFTSIGSGVWFAASEIYRSTGTNQNQHINFGQRPFTSLPSGFKALCTANLPAVTIANPKKHFDVLLYTGDGTSSRTISGASFQPDFLWSKSRSLRSHTLWDSVRGVGVSKELSSNITDAEGGATIVTANFGYISAITSSGFSLSAGGTNSNAINSNGEVFTNWLWKANGAGVTNNAGSITSTVSANTTAGFSIVTYTGTGANATVGHGLGVAPKMVIVKDRDAVTSWRIYHSNSNATPQNYALYFDTSAATLESAAWNNTAPTSSVFSVGTNTSTSTRKYLALVFSEVPGFSKFGIVQGNASADGVFGYCGFRPRWILFKEVANANNWYIYDTARDTYNVDINPLWPNTSAAEATSSNYAIDILSNGFKFRTSVAGNNTGGTIFAAFAEYPFGGYNVSPSTAR